MTRIDLKRTIEMREERVEANHAALVKSTNIKRLSAQGSAGAETEFFDSEKLRESIEKDTSHLANAYNFQDTE